MKLLVQKATTDVSVYLFVQNSSVTTGAGLTGLAYNSASLVAYYVRPLGSATAITLATQTVTGAHSDGGFVEVDATNMPGVYRLDLPDAVCATGVNSVVVMLKGATNMAPVTLEIQLSSFNPNDSVRLGLTALPNAAADAAGGLPISDAGGLDLDAKIGALTFGTANRVNAQVYGMEANTITAAATAADYITEVQTAITGGAYDLDTDANGRVRIVDGTGAGEINTTSGVVEARLADGVGHGGSNTTLTLSSDGTISPLTIASGGFPSLGPAVSIYREAGAIIRIFGDSNNVGIDFTTADKAIACYGSAASDLQGTWNAAWDAEVQSECEDALAAYGASTLTAAGIRTAVGMASANLDTQLDALPTNAELATALAAADDAVLAAIAALNNLSAAQVNAEVVDALATDTYAEPGQGAPAATASLAAKINWLYASWRNLKTNDGTTTKLYADDGTTVVAKQTTGESAGTVSKAEWVTGP